MKTLNAYSFNELSPTAKLEADKEAMIYASHTFLQSVQKAPPGAVSSIFNMARQEWLSSWFDDSGKLRFPPQLFKETDTGGANDGGAKEPQS